jgi:predicted helicase
LTVAADTSHVVDPTRFGFRSFDRQWLIPDNRLLLSSRPELWESFGKKQVFAVSLERRAPESGPALTYSGLLPDMNYYKGSSGGRVFPLWRDRGATESNIRPEFLTFLADLYQRPVTAEDVMAYLAALLAHPAFTARFAADLVRPACGCRSRPIRHLRRSRRAWPRGRVAALLRRALR